MQALTSRIPTRGERQAMDWSLVLASQGIETIIERDPEAGTWQLLVPGTDYTRALQSIRQYLKENQHRRWCQELPVRGLMLDWRSIAPMVLFILIYAADLNGRFRSAGVMNSEAVRAGEWWRLFTAVTLHADLTHLAANVTTGLLFIGLAMGAFGPGLGLLAPFLAGALGNLAGLALYGPVHQSLGASGMVLGALGLVTAHSLLLYRHGSGPRFLIIRAVLSGSMLLVLIGLNPQGNVDLVAHVAGFVAGFALGALLSWRPQWILAATSLPAGFNAAEAPLVESEPAGKTRVWVDRLTLCLSLLAFAVPWYCALHRTAILIAAGAGCLAVLARPQSGTSPARMRTPPGPGPAHTTADSTGSAGTGGAV